LLLQWVARVTAIVWRILLSGEGAQAQGHAKSAQSVLPDFADRLTLERHRRVGAMIPILYLAIGINTLAATLASQGDFPIVYQLVLPGILLFASGWRYLVWRQRRSSPISPETARKHLRKAFILAAMLSLFGGLWTVSAYFEVHETRRALTAFFIIISGVVTATCLAAMPRAPQVAIGIAHAPIALAMLFSNDLGLQAIAISIILLTALVMHQAAHYAMELENNLRLQEKLEHQAWYDSLTGIPNRRAFANAFEDARQRAGDGDQFTVMMVDLDGFKAANDMFGHVAGDGVLVETAQRLQNLFPDARIIARFGGDEFVLLFAGPARSDWEERREAASKLLAMPVVDAIHTIPISASFGYAQAPASEAHLDKLLIAADGQLYDDKAKRRSPVRRRA